MQLKQIRSWQTLCGLHDTVQTFSSLSCGVIAVCATRPLEPGSVSSVWHDTCAGPLTRLSRFWQRTLLLESKCAVYVLGGCRLSWTSCFTPFLLLKLNTRSPVADGTSMQNVRRWCENRICPRGNCHHGSANTGNHQKLHHYERVRIPSGTNK